VLRSVFSVIADGFSRPAAICSPIARIASTIS
jgi:hypothetical protein